MTNNLCAKTVTPEHAYEVWQTYDGAFTYFVLKKYQSPEEEKNNPFARWYVRAQSPFTGTQGEYGDAYVRSVVSGARMIANPLHHFLVVGRVTITDLQTIGLRSYTIIRLDTVDHHLWDYCKIMLPPGDINKVKRILQEYAIRIICSDCEDFVARCLTDMQMGGHHDTGMTTD